MTFMPWSPALSVGLTHIDDQHRWLVDLINHLYDALQSEQSDRDQIGAALEAVMDYTMNHFVAEEVLFQQYHYPDAAAHEAQHDALTYKVMALITDYENGKELREDVLALFTHWLAQHIMVSDKAYAAFLPPDAVPEVRMAA